jgi:hypothetical protein
MAAPSAQDEQPLSEHSISIRPLSAEETDERSAALSEVLIDCEGSAPVSFMASLDHGRAEAFWWGVARGERTLLIAEDRAGSAVVGTGAVVLGQSENQLHRADVSRCWPPPSP